MREPGEGDEEGRVQGSLEHMVMERTRSDHTAFLNSTLKLNGYQVVLLHRILTIRLQGEKRNPMPRGRLTDEEDEYFFRMDQKKVKEIREELDKKRAKQNRAKRKESNWMKCPKCGSDLEEIND